MPESKELTIRKSDVASFVQITSAVPGEPLYNGLMAILNYVNKYADNDAEGARKDAYENRFNFGELWRKLKEFEKMIKQVKPMVEAIASDVTMPDVFKWQAGAKKTSKEVSNNYELWLRMEKEGVSLESFLTRACKVDFSAAVELVGKSEVAFLEEFAGDIVNVETKQNKPTLKGL